MVYYVSGTGTISFLSGEFSLLKENTLTQDHSNVVWSVIRWGQGI